MIFYKRLFIVILLLLWSSFEVGTIPVYAQVIKPKILLLYDMEGISGINRQVQCNYPTPEYENARRLLTADVNAAIRGLKAGGAGEIVVIDGHGSGNWLEPDIILADLDKRAEMGFRDTPYDPYTSPDASFNAIVSDGACVLLHQHL